MKSKISLFNQAVFKKNLTRGWVLWAGLLAFYMLAIPGSIYSSMSHYQIYNKDSDLALSVVYRFTMIASAWAGLRSLVPVFALAALFCAMHVFSYLFTARNSNMMHTYPVSRVSLFFTNFASGILHLFAPLLAAAVTTLLIGAAQGAVNAQTLKYYGIWLVVVFVENVFFFSMAVCVLMFVGNIIAVPVLYLILNFLYEGCIFIARTMIQAVCYGMDNTASFGGFGVLTPIVYLRRVGLQYVHDYEAPDYTLQRMEALLGYLAAAVLFAAIALLVYQKKHIETAGDVITVNWLKPIFRWGMAVCTSSLGAMLLYYAYGTKTFGSILISVAVIGILVFFIAQMLLDRSIRVFTKRKIQECLLYTVVICGCYFALELDIAGLERKIPNVGEIEAVRVSGAVSLLAFEEEEISWASEMHRRIVDAKKEFERKTADRAQPTQFTEFEYLLKDNTILTRRYEIPIDHEKESVYGQMAEYAGREEVILKQLFGVHYPEIKVYGGRWRSADTAAWNGEDGYTDAQNEEVRISEADAKQLYEAVRQDVADGNLIEEESAAEAAFETFDTEQYYGELFLEIRDEAGYQTAQNYMSIRDYRNQAFSKDGTTMIYVDERFACLVRKMRELGYLPKKES